MPMGLGSDNGSHVYSNQGGNAPSGNIKEMMNTSAPICISSYIKGSAGGARPAHKNGPRRQGNFYSGTSSGMGQHQRGGN